MYKFATKKNREDVIALRWPKACLSCGVEVPSQINHRYAIVGLFHDIKQTKVLVKLPGFFYMCNECIMIIDNALEMNLSSLEKLATDLKEHPWTEFIELGKDGHVKIPQGMFRQRLQEENPDAQFKDKRCPMEELRRRLEKES